MTDTEYVVEREIDDIEFTEHQVEEFRKQIKKELIDEGRSFTDKLVESRLTEKMEEVARQRTLEQQGHNDLHRYVEHGSPEKQ